MGDLVRLREWLRRSVELQRHLRELLGQLLALVARLLQALDRVRMPLLQPLERRHFPTQIALGVVEQLLHLDSIAVFGRVGLRGCRFVPRVHLDSRG
jgi:hypothetical protein